MAFPPSSDDRPDPLENMPAMRARIPDHVARGEISTGVIVVTGATEYVLDFVRNLPRPNAVVARVVLPHMVMPQFIEALTTNVELFRQRYGDLPGAPASHGIESHVTHVGPAIPIVPSKPITEQDTELPQAAHSQLPDAPLAEGGAGSAGVASNDLAPKSDSSAPAHPSVPPASNAPGQNPGAQVRRQNPQDVYDELKLRDEILSGAYANAVMIGHGPYEFSFDFITNFYPQSAVSCRVYLASGHIWRLLESLKQSWEQLRPRLGYPPPQQPPQQPPSNPPTR